MSQPRPYSLFISSGAGVSADRERLDICMQASWEAGHAARSVLSRITRPDIQREIQQSDIFVRLCSDLDDSVKAECFWAIDAGKPILLLLSDEVHRGKIEALLENSTTVSSFRVVSSDPATFVAEYLIELHRVVRSLDVASFAGGTTTPISDSPIHNPFWRRFAQIANQWATFDWRFKLNLPLKRAAAEFFLDRYMPLLIDGRVQRTFFESGSSTAVLSEAYAARLGQMNRKLLEGTLVETNNIISYMEFILQQYTRVALFPAGHPDRKYGGTFGDLNQLPIPHLQIPKLSDDAHDQMDSLRDHFSDQYKDVGIIFGAVSGIDLTSGTDLVGPHTGSFHNMLFKRALLESGAPVVLLVDEDKLPRPAIPGQCFLVCDQDFSWPFACRNMPIALACAFRSERRAKEIIEQLKDFSLDHVEPSRPGEAPWSFVISNRLFQAQVESWSQVTSLAFTPDTLRLNKNEPRRVRT